LETVFKVPPIYEYCRIDRYKYLVPLGKAAAKLEPPALIMELGAWWGKATVWMAHHAKSGVDVIAVDNFKGSMNHVEIPHFKSFDKIAKDQHVPTPQEFFWHSVRHFDRHKSIKLATGEFDVVAEKVNDGVIDMLFVDGDHFQTTHDLITWWPKVKKGGTIFCHDVDKQHFTVGDEFRIFCEHHDRCWDVDGELGWVVK